MCILAFPRPAPARPAPALVALAVALAAAPGVATAARDPAHAQAEAPRLAYRSAFSLYRPWQEQAVGDWRALNDRVGRIGGWRTYLREAHEPEPASPTPAGGTGDDGAQPPAARHGQGTRHGGTPHRADPGGQDHRVHHGPRQGTGSTPPSGHPGRHGNDPALPAVPGGGGR